MVVCVRAPAFQPLRVIPAQQIAFDGQPATRVLPAAIGTARRQGGQGAADRHGDVRAGIEQGAALMCQG